MFDDAVVLITGGTGFIGQCLAHCLLHRGHLTTPSGVDAEIDSLLLLDAAAQDVRPDWYDERVEVWAGDISQRALLTEAIDRDDVSVFHLASVVSGAGEQLFDLALAINLAGGLNVLEACRARGGPTRLVFASSIAVFGGAAMPETVGDVTKQAPQTTYGVTKAISELLINDYTRKGFLDGRSARLPTVIVRPGAPNAAASSFVSGLFREPLNGQPCVLPVGLDTVMPVIGYRTVVECLIRLHELDGTALGEDRAVGLPALSLSVGEMVETLRRVAGDRPLGDITVEPDPFVEAICRTWPRDIAFDRATALGLPCDSSLDDIVRAYIEDFVDTAA